MKRDGNWEVLEGGIRRRLVAVGHNLMTMEVQFEIGAVGSMHQHPHEQFSVVKIGRFRFTLGEQTLDLMTGDTVFVPSNVLHGVVTLEAGVLVDVFSPLRMDLLED